MRVRDYIIGGAQRAVLFALLWWALAGGGTLTSSVGGVAFGAAAIAVAVAMSLMLLAPSGRFIRPLAIAMFAIFFLRESVLGGVQVAWRAFSTHPARHTEGTYFLHQTTLPPGPARSFFAGTVGLMPGTVTVEATGPDLRIHVLDRELLDRDRIEKLERHIANL